MTEEYLISLIMRRLSGELDPIGEKELTAWTAKDAANQALIDRIFIESEWGGEMEKYRAIDPEMGYARWLDGMRARRHAKVLRISQWAVAASLLLALLIGAWLWRTTPERKTKMPIARVNQPVSPGRNTAQLILSNGRKILLDSAGVGDLAMQGNTRLFKADSGSVQYEQGQENSALAMVGYNVLVTPRAGQYQLTLSDGTKVWLNNVSSLRFPTAFVGNQRAVELSGEAYFEVAKDAKKPFVVKVGGESVEVLGTSFNIMAYPEEGGTQTTLLTGAVRVRSGNTFVQLRPDEQARLNSTGGIAVLKHVGAEDIASWRKGFFYFGRASFEVVMRQLARWYDIEVVYEGKVPEIEFGGKIDRGLTLDELLKYLDKNQLHFRVEGRRLVVLSR